jgi:glycosyltransferase involved in cell wall biosynthesis
MKVSIITASYNSAENIAFALKSVANQQYNDIEHIIIDGNSSDDTIRIVSDFSHVRVLVSEPDKGIYDAMNKGISMATGDIVGILNSDDYYVSDDVIDKVAQVFKNDPTVECLYADLDYVSKSNTSRTIRKWRSGKYDERSFYMGWMPPHPTFFVRRELYKTYGDFNLTLHTAADYELMLRFLLRFKAKCYYLQQTIIHMRTGGASNLSLWARIKANRQDKKAWALNNLHPRFYTLYLKPFRKILQYIII